MWSPFFAPFSLPETLPNSIPSRPSAPAQPDSKHIALPEGGIVTPLNQKHCAPFAPDGGIGKQKDGEFHPKRVWNRFVAHFLAIGGIGVELVGIRIPMTVCPNSSAVSTRSASKEHPRKLRFIAN